ncbi:MAG: hypothetical protein K0S39_2538 [Paenibacillus sp.]|jgi:hypothetical protein|nr:hypothetical protein [Paenibacillus sp.]
MEPNPAYAAKLRFKPQHSPISAKKCKPDETDFQNNPIVDCKRDGYGEVRPDNLRAAA